MSGNPISPDAGAAGIAAAIAEPARARMLYCLLDGPARTSTELAIVGEVSPSTASAPGSPPAARTIRPRALNACHAALSIDILCRIELPWPH